MSNWQQQQPQFNLEAPEFVPKFGNGPPGNPPQQQQQQQPPVGNTPHAFNNQMPGVGNNNQYNNNQQPRFYQHPQQQQYRQPYYQQQQQPQPQQNYYQQQPQQQYYQQQQAPPQFPQQQQNISPVKQQQQQPNINNKQQQSPSSTTDNNSSVNQLTANISKLTTTTAPPTETPKQPAPASAPTPAAPSAATVADETTTSNKDKEDSSSAKIIESSVVVEKSLAPLVATIKEDEEWEEGNEEEAAADEAAGEKTGEEGEAPKPKKKQIVIREYKSRKEPVNVIFCGHVDAGKSTIGGQIMFLTGMVDKRTLEKYEREAKEKNRESWYLSWALDTNLEEREKGKTVEVGRAFFETEKKHFIILDAPGHRGFVPNMIGGASQADIAVLVISARKGEFETGFEKGGQTREHAMLVKTAGVKYLMVLVNKMDDPTVNWDVNRYEEIKEKLTPYIKKCGFQPGKDTFFQPCSGYTGAFIKDPVDESVCSWYRGPCFIEFLDSLPTINRASNGPVRMPIVDKYKDMGTVVMGKIESGMVKLNEKFCLMPNKTRVEITNIYCEDEETDSAICGENVKIKLKGVEEEEISSGFVLCDLKEVCQVAKVFDAQVVILECPSIICPGFNSIMHIHTSTVEVQLKTIIGLIDKKTGEKDVKNRPRFIKQDQIAICRFDVLGGSVVCMEPFKLFPQLGRFTLRYENKTVAVGKVLKVIE